MKPSGIEWIGDIPDDWEVGKLKHYYKLQTGFTPDTKNQSYYDSEKGYDWITIGDLSGDRFVNLSKSKISESYICKYEPNIIPCGSLLYSFKLSVGQVAFAGKDLYSNEAIASFLQCKDIDLNFLYYSSCLIEMNSNENIYGAKILNQDLIKNAFIVFPPLKTQQKIANYLDRKCGEIDETISKQKESIEKLKAYKHSLISETVTKGLDKSARMKPSGIPYLGSIPAHWEVKRLKELFAFGKGLPITKDDLREGGVPVISYGQIHSKDNDGISVRASLIRYVDPRYNVSNASSIAKEGDFIFADTSEDLDGCGNCVYINSKKPIFAGYHCIILKAISISESKYLAYLFKTNVWRAQIRKNVCGVKVFSVSRKILSVAFALIPPAETRRRIADYLDKNCGEIDAAISTKQSLIEKLDSFKKSLIFECVTGKQKYKAYL